MGLPARRPQLSPQEYLAFERASEEKHEYADGEIFAMSGGSLAHSELAAKMIAALAFALTGRPCRVLSSDMRVRVSPGSRYVYPDVSVVCGAPLLDDEAGDTLLNPILIVEVLSDSTEAYDRGDKFIRYRALPSLRDYVLVSQREPRIEVFSRLPDESWNLRTYGPGEHVTLPSLECSIAVDPVYAGVFDALHGAETPR
jgi:Uma2 family endonuclease